MTSTKISSIAKACSDLNVLNCLLTYKQHQFVVFYDENHRITVGSRKLDSDNWHFVQPSGFFIPERNRYSNVTEFDSHNYLTMAVDKDGYIHISGNMHVDPLIYYRSEYPLDIDSLCAVRHMTNERENRVTYPLFFKDHAGNLLFRYRDGMSGNGDDLYNIYDCQTKTWSRLLDSPLLNGEGERNGYARLPISGPDGYWHMLWMWRETPNCETNNNLSYAKSKDLLHWEKANGEPIALPIDIKRGDIIDPSPVKGGLINMSQELGFDNKGRVVITYHRYDEKGNSQAYIAQFKHDSWIIKQLSNWNFRWDFKGPGSIPADIIISAVKAIDNNRLEVEYHSSWCESGVWVIDEDSLEVIEQKKYIPQLSEANYKSNQPIHANTVVHVIPSINESLKPINKYYLRWETLEIFRDVPHDEHVEPTTLELIEII